MTMMEGGSEEVESVNMREQSDEVGDERLRVGEESKVCEEEVKICEDEVIMESQVGSCKSEEKKWVGSFFGS